MITGELKNKIDGIWDCIYTYGITSPTTVIEQITYLIFMKILDDNEVKKEGNALAIGVDYKSKIFKEGKFQPDKNSTDSIDYKELRWNIFKNYEPDKMHNIVKKNLKLSNY